MNRNSRFFVFLAIAVASRLVLAQEAPPSSVKTSLDLGATLTDGNSETMKANGSVSVEAQRESLGSILGGVQANYGESEVDGENVTDLENAKAFVNVKKTLTPMTFAYVDSSVLYDDIAAIDYRVTAGPGAGFYLVKTLTDVFSLEAGLAYIWERVAEEKDDYLAVRIAERYEHTFGAGTRFWEAVEFMPEAGDTGNYLVNAEVGAEAAVNSRFSLRLVLQDKYDSEPGADLEKNDLILIGGVSLKL